MKIKKLNKGFSLVELLVVITIIAILSVVAYTAVGGQTTKARNSRRTQDLTTIQNALEIYHIEKNQYPSATAGAIDPILLTKKFLSKIPTDPRKDNLGNPIQYKYAVGANNKTFQIAATIEDDETGALTAYVVGNESGKLITGTKADGTGAGCTSSVAPSDDKVGDGDTGCIPYDFN